MKTGKTDKELLKAPSYISIGDPFKMTNSKSMRTIIKDGHLKAGHEKAFFPAKTVQEPVPHAPYEYMPLGANTKKKTLDAEGSVPTLPR